MHLSREQEQAVIQATIHLNLKPFGPNKAFHMTSLSSHLRSHCSLDLPPDRLLLYFESLFDLASLESRFGRHASFDAAAKAALTAKASAAAHPGSGKEHAGNKGDNDRPSANAQQREGGKSRDSSEKRDEEEEEEEEEMVESGQEDMAPLRRPVSLHHQQQQQQAKARRLTNTPVPAAPKLSRPFRSTATNINYKE